MVREAEVESVFTTTREGALTHIDVMRRSRSRTAVGSLLAIISGVVLFCSFLWLASLIYYYLVPTGYLRISLSSIAELATIVFLSALILVPSYWWSTSRLKTRISIGSKGILARNVLYRFENISHLGYDNPTGAQVVTTGSGGGLHGAAHATGAAIGSGVANMVSEVNWRVTHGTKTFPIIQGLKEMEARFIFGEVAGVSATYGHPFSG